MQIARVERERRHTTRLAQLLLEHCYLCAACGGVRVVPRALLHLEDLVLLADRLTETRVHFDVLSV